MSLEPNVLFRRARNALGRPQGLRVAARPLRTSRAEDFSLVGPRFRHTLPEFCAAEAARGASAAHGALLSSDAQ